MSKDIQRVMNIQLGLASDDETPELGGDVEAVAETAAVAEGAVEVADATDEVVEADQTVDELSEAHENLEEVSEALEEAAANGGISQESARFAHLAIKAACGRFYSPAIASALPSVESFTGSSSRQRNTTIALESVGTMLRSFWDAIVRQIKKLWATVKNWYLKVLDAAPRLKKKAESLAKRSTDLTGAPEEKNIDLGLMNQLHINGKAPTPQDAVKLLSALSKTADVTLGDSTSGSYEKVFDEFEAMLEAAADVEDSKLNGLKTVEEVYSKDVISTGGTSPKSLGVAIVDFATRSARALGNLPKGNAGDVKARWGDDVSVDMYGEIFGGRGIICMEPSKGNPNQTFARMARITGIRFTDYLAKPKDVDGTGSFKTLSSSEIRSICDEISDCCDHVMTYKKAWEKRDKEQSKMDAAAKKAIATVEKDKDAPALKVRIVKDVANGLASYWQIGVRFDTQFINYLLAVSRSMFTWVERSIAQYK